MGGKLGHYLEMWDNGMAIVKYKWRYFFISELNVFQATSFVPRPINMFLLRFLIGFWHVELFYLINTNIKYNTNQTGTNTREGQTLHVSFMIWREVLRGDIQKTDDKCVTIVYINVVHYILCKKTLPQKRDQDTPPFLSHFLA